MFRCGNEGKAVIRNNNSTKNINIEKWTLSTLVQAKKPHRLVRLVMGKNSMSVPHFVNPINSIFYLLDFYLLEKRKCHILLIFTNLNTALPEVFSQMTLQFESSSACRLSSSMTSMVFSEIHCVSNR